MDPAAQSWASILGWASAIGLIGLGLGLMSSNPTNIERPILVGAFTGVGGLVIAGLMWHTQNEGGPFSWSQIVAFLFTGALIFGWGRLIDYIMGPTPINREADEETFGAHLSD